MAGVPAAPLAAHRQPAPADQQGKRPAPRASQHRLDLTSLRGLPATLDRLRIDCQLAEAIATGFDPLHLAEVFGISEHDRDPLRGQRPATDRMGGASASTPDTVTLDYAGTAGP